MLFSLGFTADVAAAHRHEFSQTREPDAGPSMFREAPSLGLYKPKDASSPQYPNPPHILTSRPSQTTIESSSGGEEEVEEEYNANANANAATAKSYAPPRQRVNRSKTVFQFAHPVASRRRLKLRPKLLLQLHEANRSSRPFPKYDVLPADMTTKLVCRLSKPIGNTRAFGSKDLIIVTSDMYEQQSTSDDRSISSDEACVEQREVVATICQLAPVSDDIPRVPKVEIAFTSGSSLFLGSQLPNGSYELVSKIGNPATRKIRWVARDKKPRQGSGLSSSTVSTSTPSRFTFSVIDPNSRRHPVIASMTRKGLIVFDQFSYPSAQPGDEQSPPGSPSTMSTRSSTHERGLINTDEELRQLIVMTGTWVAFMEGWSTKSLTNTESATRLDVPMSPRTRSSLHLSAEEDSAGDRPGAISRMNSFSAAKKIINRRSTHSDVGRQRPAEQDGNGSTKPRRSKSLTPADRGERWTDIVTDKTIESGQLAEPTTQDNVHDLYEEDDSRTKSKRWRRLSTMFGRKKR